MNNVTTLLCIASGGAAGALLRYLTQQIFDNESLLFPIGTTIVNLVGSFVMGALAAYFIHHLNPALKHFLLPGLLGAFTTYSAFALHALMLLQQHQFKTALLYVAINTAGSIALAALGYLGIERLYTT